MKNKTLPIIRTASKAKRVAAYCRVSTLQELQLHSLEAQKTYWEEKIRQNKEWEYAGVYWDEGISGTGIAKREGFKRLMKAAMDQEVDLILCKSISRFARNTTDLLNTTRKLKNKGIAVEFEKENINTLTADGELFLTLFAQFAQAESESLSNNVMWRVLTDRENGISTPQNAPLGYNWINGELKVNKEEAKIVRRIYREYSGGLSGRQIACNLNKDDIKTRKGGRWNATGIYYILRNSIYCGDLLMGKSYSTGPISGKVKKNKGEKEMILVENDHTPIIKREKWIELQKMIRERTKGKH